MDIQLMRWLAAPLLTAGVVCLAQANPFGTSPPNSAGGVASTIFNATGSLSSQPPRTTKLTVVSKWNCTSPGPTTCSFNTPSGLATQVSVTLWSSSTTRPLTNTCIGVGGGTKAWDFGAAPQRIQCGGSNGCTIPSSGNKVLDLTTFSVSTSQPMIIAVDYSAASFNDARYNVTVSPANTSPAATNTGNYNTYVLTGVQEACAAANARSTGYANNAGAIFSVKTVAVQ